MEQAERWLLIEELYHQAIGMPEGEQAMFLSRRCAGDETLRAEIESLLTYGRQTDSFLDRPAADVMAEAIGAGFSDGGDEIASSMIGKLVSRYRIVAKLASGGMGEVFSAVRADDEYRREVALKLISAGRYSSAFIQRFKQERQILASLDHPNIAHLYDGGTTEDGAPFFVMELIDGENIVAHCDHRRLTISERLKLFLDLCSAVAYAHRRLIVHRDIKPGNILVTAQGVVKLTDFGIAKMLEPDVGSQSITVTNLGAFTPAYASPEQVRGEPVTTATDVYSLGIVLYQLLTGRTPHRFASGAVHKMVHEICEVPPEPPSAAVLRAEKRQAEIEVDSSTSPVVSLEVSAGKLSKRLAGDLDAIVLRALSKEPERRYSSVDNLGEDVSRHLENLPVLARRDSFAYRASKFVSRHKIFVIAAALTLVIFAAGISTIVYEAHVARIERTRAEQRFESLRKLAHSLIYDIHDSIRDLPGSTAARKLVVEQALEYLDGLSKDAAGDAGLERELAAAYERVGDVQGSDRFANLGDTAGALASYGKALVIRQRLAALSTDDRDQLALSVIYQRLSACLLAAGQTSQAMDDARKGYTIAEQLAARNPNDRSLQDIWAGASFTMALALNEVRDLPGAAEYYAKSASIREAIQGGPPEFQKGVKMRLAGSYGYLSGTKSEQGDLDQAIALQEKSRDLLTELLHEDLHNSTIRQFLLQSEFWIGHYYAKKGEMSQALPHYRAALKGYETLVAADPNDALAKHYLAMCNKEMARQSSSPSAKNNSF